MILNEKQRFLIPPHPLIQKYYQNEPRFNGVYSRDNLPDKLKDGAYVINLEDHSDIGTHWIPFYATKRMLLILIVWELIIFQKKLKYW